MNQLVIKLTGQVNLSNFDEWKKDLIGVLGVKRRLGGQIFNLDNSLCWV
jgi:hypothetical protein